MTICSDDAEGQIGIFAYAARALGLMTLDFLPTLKRYREVVIDTEHELFFTTETVPLMIERHGWTEAMIEFVLWLLLIGNTNGLNSDVWAHWELGKAVKGKHTPASLAELTRRLLGTPEPPDPRYPVQHTYRGVDHFRRDLGILEDDWLAAYFVLLKTPEPEPEPEEQAKA